MRQITRLKTVILYELQRLCNLNDNELGEALLNHILKSKVISAPGSEKRKETNMEYKNKTGLKSIRSQMKGSLMVSVSLQDGLLTFIPTVNGGSSGPGKGYIHKPEKKIEMEISDDFVLIGSCLKEAFKLCV